MTPSPSWQRYAKDFTKIIEGFRYSRGIRENFNDWLEIAAFAIHQEPYHLGLVPRDNAFQKIETDYLSAVDRYNSEELQAFAKLLGMTKLALGETYGDFLGSIYMGLEISQDRSGEFFTPYPVSLMMAKMTLIDISAQLQEKGFITVAEPACGGGGMLIAAAQALAESGHDPGSTMFFEATDISRPCFNMAYLQTSILGLSGLVRHGNTLSNEVWSQRFTSICRVFPWRTRRFLASLTGAPEEQDAPADLVSVEADNTPDQAAPSNTQQTDTGLPDDLAQAGKNYEQGRLF